MKTELALWRQLILLLTALEISETKKRAKAAAADHYSKHHSLSFFFALVTSLGDLERRLPYPTVAPQSQSVCQGVGVVGVKSLEFGETFLAPPPL